MDLGLTGKVAVITGGSEGLGKASARRLLEEGAKVAICARRQEVLLQAADELQKDTNGEVLAVKADVTKAEEVQNFIDRTIERFGRIDILVNNAGKSAAFPFEQATDEIWLEDIEIKLMGAVRCARLVIPYMKKQGGGRIINMTTVGGKAPGGRSVPTSVTRAAGINLTKALSKEYAPYNILVNTICLGIIRSAQGARLAKARSPQMTAEEFYAERAKEIPLKRVGEAEEVGDLVAFLASERASYITGTAINIDGGTSAVV